MVTGSAGKMPRLKIGDFGLLRHRKSTKRLKEGDGNYISPELLNSDSPRDINDTADIYSLGVTLYEMATNFTVDRVVWQQIRDGELVLDNMSNDLSSLLVKMLSQDPVKRPSASEILRTCDRLRRVAASLKIALPSESNELLSSLETTTEETPNSNSGSANELEDDGEIRDNSDEYEVIHINKENLPVSPSRFSIVQPTEMANIKRKLF